MTARQLLLDGVLTLEEPVHGLVELVLVGVTDAERVRQGRVRPPTRGGDLGLGLEEARRHHGHDEVALTGRPRAQQAGKVKLPHGRHHRLDVAVRGRAVLDDLKELVGGDQLLTLEDALYGRNGLRRQLGEVGQRAALDLAVFAIALPQEDGRG